MFQSPTPARAHDSRMYARRASAPEFSSGLSDTSGSSLAASAAGSKSKISPCSPTRDRSHADSSSDDSTDLESGRASSCPPAEGACATLQAPSGEARAHPVAHGKGDLVVEVNHTARFYSDKELHVVHQLLQLLTRPATPPQSEEGGPETKSGGSSPLEGRDKRDSHHGTRSEMSLLGDLLLRFQGETRFPLPVFTSLMTALITTRFLDK